MRGGFFAGEPEAADAFLREIAAAFAQEAEPWSRLRRFTLEHPRAETALRTDGDSRVDRRVSQLLEYLPRPCRSLLDFGNGNGLITAGLARALELPPSEVVGLDSVPRAENSPDYTQMHYDPHGGGPLPAAGREFHCITLLMVLHHLEEPRAALEAMRGVLAEDGVLLIRETDAGTEGLRNFNAMMENFYYRVFNDLPDIPMPNRHMPAEFWLDLTREAGFRVERAFAVEDENPFTPFYIVAARA